jgi:GT2 family glycosyltransferase
MRLHVRVGLAKRQGGWYVNQNWRPGVVKASVVILTWNSQRIIEACLSSVLRGLSAFSSEIIVVDNGSRDRTPAIVREAFPQVQLLLNRKNRGVAPARNQGMRLAQGEYIILLDDDTVVQAGALERLIDCMDAHPEVGLCGPKLIDPQGRLQLSCRLFPTLGDKLGRRFPAPISWRIVRMAEMADWDHDTLREVDYVIGACQVIRQAALAEVGFLDERIFYGPEDVDFCLRLRQAGWRVMYNPEAVVIHEERRVTRALFSSLAWQHMWGLIYFFWKHGYLFSRRRLYGRLHRARPASQSSHAASAQTPPPTSDPFIFRQ